MKIIDRVDRISNLSGNQIPEGAAVPSSGCYVYMMASGPYASNNEGGSECVFSHFLFALKSSMSYVNDKDSYLITYLITNKLLRGTCVSQLYISYFSFGSISQF